MTYIYVFLGFITALFGIVNIVLNAVDKYVDGWAWFIALVVSSLALTIAVLFFDLANLLSFS